MCELRESTVVALVVVAILFAPLILVSSQIRFHLAATAFLSISPSPPFRVVLEIIVQLARHWRVLLEKATRVSPPMIIIR